MTKGEKVDKRINAKYPEWCRKEPKDDQNHQHISEKLVHQFLKGKFDGMEEKTEHCIKMFASCRECWWRWKRGYNSLLNKELSVLGYGSVEYGGSEKKFR
jgi:hypothetical protein